MATDYNTLKVTYAYNRVEYNELTLRYSYLPIPVQTNELDLSYSFLANDASTSFKLVGHWSDHTQMICNALPFWHAGRYEETSNYQQLINSMAMNAEYAYYQFLLARKNAFIDLAETDVIHSGYISDYPQEIPDDSDRITENVLYNSDFAIPGRAISDLPCRWSIDKSTGSIVKLSESHCLSAGNALQVQTNSGEYASIYQTYSAKAPAGQNIVLSTFVNVPNNSSSVDLNASGSAALHLEVIYVDGTTDQTSIDIPLSTTEEGILSDNSTGQISYWRRIHGSISLSKTSAYVKCYIKSDYTNSTSDFLAYIDCIQLEAGSTIPSRWKNSYINALPWLNYEESPNAKYDVYSNNTSSYSQSSVVLNSNTSYIDIRPKTKLNLCANEESFYNNAIPTRLISITETAENGINHNTRGSITNIYDTLLSTIKWEPNPMDASEISKTSLRFRDDHGSFSISERDYFNDDLNRYTVIKDHMSSGSETYTLAIRALTIVNDYLVAFCRESLGAGVYYTFKFISPNRGPQGTYLECIQDFKVPDVTASEFITKVETGTILFSQIGKVEGSRSKFVIETNDGAVKYMTDFAYDYYIDAGDGQFFTREKYDQICVT
jgi:hypothetical protein